MAKFVCKLHGNFQEVLDTINKEIFEGSKAASNEEGSDFSLENVRCAVRVYERYSFLGGNRVSLNLTLFGTDNNIKLVAITSGGSQSMFLNVNTVGEDAFIEKLKVIIAQFIPNE